jgi:catalase
MTFHRPVETIGFVVNGAAAIAIEASLPIAVVGIDWTVRLVDKESRVIDVDLTLNELPLKISGDADSYDHHQVNEDFSQAGDLYRLMSVDQKSQLIGNLASALKSVPRIIQERQLGHSYKADPDYGARVAGGLGIAVQAIVGQAA